VVEAFCRAPGVRPKNKGFGNPFQINPTPCKNEAQPTQKQWGTIRRWICALKKKKKRTKNGVGEFRVLWKKNGGNEKMGGSGGAWWGRRAGGGAVGGGEVMGGNGFGF
jgi:hypothetical protein